MFPLGRLKGFGLIVKTSRRSLCCHLPGFNASALQASQLSGIVFLPQTEAQLSLSDAQCAILWKRHPPTGA